MSILTIEQHGSAREALADAGVRHGNIEEIDIAVGTMPVSKKEQRMAFCSASVSRRKTVYWAKKREHRKPIVGDIVIRNAGEVLRHVFGKTGIARMRGRVHTNGHVVLTIYPETIEVDSVTVNPVVLRSSLGREFSRQLLEQLG